jgi:glucose dehydrogenase
MRTALTGTLVIALATPTAQAGSAVTWQDILADQRTAGDVVSYGLGPQGQRYSPLARIDRANVAELVPAWAFSFTGGKQRGQEAQPLVHDGTILVTASYSRIFAVDAGPAGPTITSVRQAFLTQRRQDSPFGKSRLPDRPQ